MERKNTLLLTVIAVATLLVAVVGATFAYFTASSAGSAESQVQVQTSSIDSVNTTATPLTLNVTLQDMLEADGLDDHTVFKDASSTITMTAGTGTGGGTNTCTYDITYTPTTIFTPSAAAAGAREFTILATANAGTGTSSIDEIVEVDLATASTIGTPLTLAQDVTYAVTGVEATGTVSWTFEVRFYNLAVDQNTAAGKTYGGTLAFADVVCENTAP